jgi:methyl-accepting chemotaxis protein
MLLFSGGAFWYLQVNIGKVLGEVHSQLVELTKFNEDRELKRRAGEEVSLYLNSMTAQLSQVTVEQSGRSQQQASSVVEITTSLNELGKTSRQIAANSEQVAHAADYGLQSSHRVREVSLRANTTAGRGQEAVSSSIRSIEEVRQGITDLAERLKVLTERSRQIVSIVGFIREISDETHLLALNAAIESAGSSQQSQRFGVVAAEVKSLADRTLEATREVEQVIGELQGAVAEAVLASEETSKKTFGAVERSYQAGEVITELGQVVDEAALKAVEILEAVQKVFNLSEEISLATRQQDSAVRQIIASMEGIGMVAQENASAVLQITTTVSQIDNLSTQLREVLNSNQQAVALALSAA